MGLWAGSFFEDRPGVGPHAKRRGGGWKHRFVSEEKAPGPLRIPLPFQRKRTTIGRSKPEQTETEVSYYGLYDDSSR